jgi:hypothetical protein
MKLEATLSSETSVLKKAHGVTSQKTAFLIVIDVSTRNLTYAMKSFMIYNLCQI